MRAGLKNAMKTLSSLGVPYQTAGDAIRISITFTGPNEVKCEVSKGDYGNSWIGFSSEGRASKEICKAIENLFKKGELDT